MLKQQAIFTAQPWLAKVGPSQSHPPNPDSQERVPPQSHPPTPTRRSESLPKQGRQVKTRPQA
jgi:hypothetical protein